MHEEALIPDNTADMGIQGVGGRGIQWHARRGGVHDMITQVTGHGSIAALNDPRNCLCMAHFHFSQFSIILHIKEPKLICSYILFTH